MDVVAVVGIGYLGLPLAVAFGKIMPTIGYGLGSRKLGHYRRRRDPNDTFNAEKMRVARQRTLTVDAGQLGLTNVFIIAVPTPIDAPSTADFAALIKPGGCFIGRKATLDIANAQV